MSVPLEDCSPKGVKLSFHHDDSSETVKREMYVSSNMISLNNYVKWDIPAQQKLVPSPFDCPKLVLSIPLKSCVAFSLDLLPSLISQKLAEFAVNFKTFKFNSIILRVNKFFEGSLSVQFFPQHWRGLCPRPTYDRFVCGGRTGETLVDLRGTQFCPNKRKSPWSTSGNVPRSYGSIIFACSTNLTLEVDVQYGISFKGLIPDKKKFKYVAKTMASEVVESICDELVESDQQLLDLADNMPYQRVPVDVDDNDQHWVNVQTDKVTVDYGGGVKGLADAASS